MSRFLTVGAAQMGPIQRSHTRRDVVERMIAHLREAKRMGCELVVFPELTLTTFFPRWWMTDQAEVDSFFEKEMPSNETEPLFNEAKALGLGFSFGYAELANEGGKARHFNTSIIVERDGRIASKYRKIHLPGHAEHEPWRQFQHLEKRYFEPGDLGDELSGRGGADRNGPGEGLAEAALEPLAGAARHFGIQVDVEVGARQAPQVEIEAARRPRGSALRIAQPAAQHIRTDATQQPAEPQQAERDGGTPREYGRGQQQCAREEREDCRDGGKQHEYDGTQVRVLGDQWLCCGQRSVQAVVYRVDGQQKCHGYADQRDDDRATPAVRAGFRGCGCDRRFRHGPTLAGRTDRLRRRNLRIVNSG